MTRHLPAAPTNRRNAFNSVSQRALSARPNDLIQWQAIHVAVAIGCRRHDLGDAVYRYL
jgi:hypothetical protein